MKASFNFNKFLDLIIKQRNSSTEKQNSKNRVRSSDRKNELKIKKIKSKPKENIRKIMMVSIKKRNLSDKISYKNNYRNIFDINNALSLYEDKIQNELKPGVVVIETIENNKSFCKKDKININNVAINCKKISNSL